MDAEMKRRLRDTIIHEMKRRNMKEHYQHTIVNGIEYQ